MLRDITLRLRESHFRHLSDWMAGRRDDHPSGASSHRAWLPDVMDQQGHNHSYLNVDGYGNH